MMYSLIIQQHNINKHTLKTPIKQTKMQCRNNTKFCFESTLPSPPSPSSSHIKDKRVMGRQGGGARMMTMADERLGAAQWEE